MSDGKPPSGALLAMIDVQSGLIPVLADGERLVSRCLFAVSAAQGLGIPVAFTEQVPAKLGSTDPRLAALGGAGSVHAKDTFSALAPGSGAREALLAGGDTRHLILGGLETPICVHLTAIDALREGLEVTLLSDCVSARREADARASLEALARAGAHVLPSETVFYSLLGSASHPFFRAFVALVKKHG